MPKRAKRAKVNDEPIILVDNPMKAKHAKPPIDEHGLCLANPCRVLVVGGCGASKTTTILSHTKLGLGLEVVNAGHCNLCMWKSGLYRESEGFRV